MKYHTLSPSELETYNIGYMVGNRKMVITDVEWESDQERKIYRKGYYAGFKDWERKNKKNTMSTMSTKSTKEQMSTKSTLSDLAQCPQQRGDYRGVDMDMVMEEKRDKGVIGGKEKGVGTPNLKVTVDWADVLDRWNRIAEKYKLSKISVITAKRKQQFKARLAEHKLTPVEFFAIVNKGIGTSWFLQGQRQEVGSDGIPQMVELDNKWKASFDFCLQSQSFSRIRENFYGKDCPELLAEWELLEKGEGNAD